MRCQSIVSRESYERWYAERVVLVFFEEPWSFIDLFFDDSGL